MGDRGVIVELYRISFGGDENILKLTDHSCTSL